MLMGIFGIVSGILKTRFYLGIFRFFGGNPFSERTQRIGSIVLGIVNLLIALLILRNINLK